MKILFTGGGTGGHFYPIIAVAEELIELAHEEKIVDLKLYYMSTEPYDKRALFENSIEFVGALSGKRRIYASWKNFTDLFKLAIGLVTGLMKMFAIYPDVVFSKGAYASVPALFAARLLGIPVIIHESDSVPGRVSAWSGKFAKRIALSYPEAAKFFPDGNIALTGQPVRREIREVEKNGAFEFLKLDAGLPVVFVLGGSLGAEPINNAIMDALPDLLSRYQIVHQVGAKHLSIMTETAKVIVPDEKIREHYHPFGFLNPLAIKMCAGAATVIISRAGSTIFEIAGWGVPSILIPFASSNGDHAKKNAYAYASAGASLVIEENNLTPHVLVAEIETLVGDSKKREEMSAKAKAFATPEAAKKIAQEIINVALEHEK